MTTSGQPSLKPWDSLFGRRVQIVAFRIRSEELVQQVAEAQLHSELFTVH